MVSASLAPHHFLSDADARIRANADSGMSNSHAHARLKASCRHGNALPDFKGRLLPIADSHLGILNDLRVVVR